ncbi:MULTISPECIES: helix-turn-helix domain-containing protein [Actinokineospora]|uniref:Transcriptional regulator n=1 Tax=Actinokineospora fastidiosa TaxID=1816 RepID=A0A918G9N1_9PSEU|nr:MULTISPECIES: helix-turn-helix transcriptional regulator [Actinokineospora]UVS81905.1 Helix-turn-helix domain protein [Actinokineospora sp. UTMC 2448]GGS24925.1 transcriptional regulator [Actinokineospora fastidiosa]
MSGKRKPPQARDRTLGAQLRALRQQAGLNLEQAAEIAQISVPTLSRTENGKRHVTSEDVALLCGLYGAPAIHRAALIEAAKASDQAGWWEHPLPGVPINVGTLASHESIARALTDWSITLIPGLLQTRAYAIGYFQANGLEPPATDDLWEARKRRQAVLPRVEYTAFIHEMALRTPFGGVDALKEQLLHLHRAPERGWGVRVVRACVPLAALMHSWMLLEFPRDQPILHVELMRSAVYLHTPAVEVYESARRELFRAALPSAESSSMIEGLARRL